MLTQPHWYLLPHLASQVASQVASLLEPQDRPSPGPSTDSAHPSIPAGLSPPPLASPEAALSEVK